MDREVTPFYRKSVFWAVLCALVMGIATIPKLRGLNSPDFKVFYVAAQHAIHDPENLYKISPDRYLYPPAASFFFVPFAFTSHWDFHRVLWHILLTAIVMLICLKTGAVGVIATLFVSRYWTINFFYGQINPIILLMVLAAGWNYRRAPALSVFFWSLAGNLKVFPAVFSFSAVSEWIHGDKRKFWQAFFLSVFFTTLFFTLPFLFWPTDLAKNLYFEFFAAIQAKGLPLHSHNQSITAFFLRLLTKDSFELHGMGYTVWAFFDFPYWVPKTVGFLLGAGISFLAWRRAHQLHTGLAYATATSFTILFLSHLVWKDYFIFLFPALLPMIRVAREKILTPEVRIQRVILFVYVLLVLGSSPDIWGTTRAALFDACGIHLWGAVLLFFGWYKLSKEKHES